MRNPKSLAFGILLTIALSTVIFAGDIIDTSFDAQIDTSTFMSKTMEKVTIQPDGKMIAAGSFNRYNGQHVGGLIRVNPDGSLDSSFENDLFESPGVSSQDEIKVLSDGKILICGTFTLVGGTQQFARVIRLNADGSLDTSFAFEPSGTATRTGIDASGRVVVQGNMQYVRNGQTISKWLLRLNADGTVDDSFNTSAGADTFTTQGNKVVYLLFDLSNFQMRRLNEDGSPDSSFTQTLITNAGGFSTFLTQSDNKLLLLRAGTIVRVDADGGLDGSFQSPTFALSGTPRMVVGGDDRITLRYQTTAPFLGAKFLRLLPNGSTDATFTPYIHSPAGAPAFNVHTDGSVMIGDGGQNFGANTFVKLTSSGQADASYNAGGAGFQNIRPGKIRTIRVLPSNKILIGGDFDKVNTTVRAKLALLNPDSTIDPTFQLPTTPTGNYFSQLIDIYEIERQSDGKLLVSGSFTYFVGGLQKANVVRLNSDGTIDSSFVLGPTIADAFASSGLSTNKALQRADGKIIVGNSRPGTGPTAPERHPPVQLMADGALDATFAPELYPSQSVIGFDLAILPDGKILVVGRRTQNLGGTDSITTGVVVRLNADGREDTTFQRYEPVDKTFVACRVLPNGKILIIQRSTTSSHVFTLNADARQTPHSTTDREPTEN
jgi:uncharacterized delta-60 repeat protein